MIVVDAGQRDVKSFDAKILFAAQLSDAGHKVVIDEKTAPQTFDRNQKYEAAPFLADLSQVDISAYVMIGAESICDETLMMLRGYELDADIPVSATGRFNDDQTQFASASKISFALGREANVIDLNELQNGQILATSINPLVTAPAHAPENASTPVELFLYVPEDLLEETETLPLLSAMDQLPGFQLNILISGKGKDLIQRSRSAGLSVFALSEMSPAIFARRAGLAVFLGDGVPGERMAGFAQDVMSKAGVLVDCTTNGAFVSSGAPALRGPVELAALPNFLQYTVLSNLDEIGRQARQSDWLESTSIQGLQGALKIGPPNKGPSQNEPAPSRTVFLPTNGNGLGHAQRCTLIAQAMASPTAPSFAAFPSCIPLINSKGFSATPLVQKSDDHAEPFANDLVNYLRLRRLLRTGDHLVFDGGYVFDSIYRTVMEKSLRATWIRRGLWRAGQATDASLEREKAFDQVIVPQEAFSELNTAYTHGQKIHQVGPIVQELVHPPDGGAGLKQQLATTFDHAFDELVVTMLGGGVASDRSAQMQALCSMLERRPRCLHLIVVWPGSRVSPGLHGWKNTHVVKTKQALALCQAADLVVSAVGYNSYHEILYHHIPSILIPQTAPYLDDQEKRARAASDRGLAATVLADELLILEREVNGFLDGGKSETIRQNLSNASLPERGNELAAKLIDAKGQA